MNTLNPMANMQPMNEQKPKEQKHSREVHSTDVDLKDGLNVMRILSTVIYVLAGIAVVASLVVSNKERNGYIFLAALGGSIIPISFGMMLRKVADIAEYISDKVK